MDSELPVEPQSLKKLSFKSLKRALDIFSPLHGHFPPPDPESKKIRISHKLNLEYGAIVSKAAHSNSKAAAQNQAQKASAPSNALALPGPENARDPQKGVPKNELALGPSLQPKSASDGFSGRSTAVIPSQHTSSERNLSTAAIMERIPSKWPRPVWHPPWKNYRVISGHLGWVRSVAVDHSNSWFCTGSADRTIKIWDLATGTLKLTLTGHIEQIRGLAVSNKHTYMFSAGDDKQVKCWDLEQNKVIRSYHGHLSGVYCLALHPTIDVLLTGGRDSVCRVWDIRSKMQIHALSGHENTVCSVFTRPMDPQVITGSHDSTIKFWDLRYGKTMATLTHHKKSVRAMALHPKEDAFASASADNIKKFNLPKGEFFHNMLSQQKTIINAMAVNDEGVMATGGDNGSLWFWDWRSGHNFQQSQTIVQPGSLESEAGIYALTYDVTGTRLISCEADKTIKMWKEDDNAAPETHPLNFKPPRDIRRF
ncbi:PREDICTED: protein pleiotropic regulatory locus 1-like [Ipomoea nil]|uniref:protein pleiotropic regulatory locus 1-like n=1 Tax=Ipomoea nil TaxID=35883 RepID=UPI000901ACAA|nr:PREDICTED: protein pleiotropic regulatory locus 1-like [Ipomoea nil]